MCSRICKHNYRITIIVKIGYHDHSPAGLVVTGVPLARDDMHSPRATIKHTPCICVYNTVHELCDIRDISVNGEIYTVVGMFVNPFCTD